MRNIIYKYTVLDNDFLAAGEASADLKQKLLALDIPADEVRRCVISLYEGEINLTLHANGGEITVTVLDDKIILELQDKGPGIEDISLAMTEGYSEADSSIRSLGFGAGMGLPNMKKHSDEFFIDSVVGEGTYIKMAIHL